MTAKQTQQLKKGLLEAVPISISTFVFGAIFGVIATNTGLNVVESTAMSFISFAGAAQLSILQFIGEAGLGTIFFTTFLLNARHLLYGLSLSGHVQQASWQKKNVIGFLLSDSMFALANRRLKTDTADLSYFIGAGLTVYVAWSIGTLIGAMSSQLFETANTVGLAFASTACFIILLVAEITTLKRFMTCIVCGIFVISVAKYVPTGVLLLLAGLLAFVIGTFSGEEV